MPSIPAPGASDWAKREAMARFTGCGLAQAQDLPSDDLDELWEMVWAEDVCLALECMEKFP